MPFKHIRQWDYHLEAQGTPKAILDTIQTKIKEGKHFWLYKDETVSDIKDKMNRHIH